MTESSDRRRLPRPRVTIAVAVAVVTLGISLAPLLDRPPLRTGAYVQAVSTSSAVLRMATDQPRSLGALILDQPTMRFPAREPTREHRFLVEGLEPATEYAYAFVDADGDPVGTGRFRTRADSDDARVDFAVIGDSGDQPFWIDLQRAPLARLLWFGGILPSASSAPAAVGRLLAAEEPDFWLHTGDVIYPKGALHHYETGYFVPFAGVNGSACCYPVLGNHDVMTGDGAPFLACFEWPETAPSGRHFTFRDGPLRVVGLDLNQPVGPDHDGLVFLREQAARGEPWLIVMSHFPVQTVYREPWRQDIVDHYLPLCRELGVDLVLAGHDHLYQRFGEPGPDGATIEVGTAGGGKDLYEIRHQHDELATATVAYHACFVTIEGLELTLEARSIDGAILDRFTIDKRAQLAAGSIRGGEARQARTRALAD